MARLELEGIDDLNAAINRMNPIPDGVKTEMLDAMTKAAMPAIRQSGQSLGVYDPESGEHVIDKLKANKPKLTKDGGSQDITFSGSRQRGSKKVRNAEIAFINEYGTRKQPARPFMGQAMTKNEKAIVDAAEEPLGNWMESEFNK